MSRHFKGRSDFSWEDVLELAIQKPEIFNANAKFIRNEGETMVEGQKLWRRAKRVIRGSFKAVRDVPTGTMARLFLKSKGMQKGP